MAAEGSEEEAEVVQARRQMGQEGVGAALGEAPMDVDGLLARGQRLLAAAEVGEADSEVVQARRQVGPEGVGAVVCGVPLDLPGPLAEGPPRPFPAPDRA